MMHAESPVLALQKAIFVTLKDKIKSVITNKDVPVFDVPKHGQPFPYIVIGEEDGTPLVTKTNYGELVTYTIHAFSDYHGSQEAKGIIASIKALMTVDYLDLSANNFNHFTLDIPFFQTFKDETGSADGGEKFHGVVKFDFGIQKI
jgi:hypothetical protein